MIEAIGVYSEADNSLTVHISADKVVVLRCTEDTKHLKDGVHYFVAAEFEVEYGKNIRFRVRILTAVPVSSDKVREFVNYKGVFRINEAAGGMREKQGEKLLFYRGDAFSTELRNVALDKRMGWVTIAVPKSASPYIYRPGDLLYVDGTVFHKNRNADGVQKYELCVRASHCHKVDGTEYWERVRDVCYCARRSKKDDSEEIKT